MAAAFVIGLMVDAALGAKRTEVASPGDAAKRTEVASPGDAAKRTEVASPGDAAGGGASTSPCSCAKARTWRSTALCICALVMGTAVCYGLGTIWFILSTGTGLMASLTACVFPFLPGDALKILVAAMLIGKLRRHLP